MAAPSPNRPKDDELRRLYEDERLTTRQIGERFNVRHMTIRRWMKAAEISPRPSGDGLLARGVEPPTREELRALIHDQHLGYRKVAELFGVDFTAIPQWLDAHGIERPSVWGTRRRGRVANEPTEGELRARISSGESLTSIARDYEVSRTTLRNRCESYGIEVRPDGWVGGHRLDCKDGHHARSVYEQRVDDWLFDHGVEHYTEPAYPWDRRYRADFRVGSIFIEVWGVTNNAAYQDRKAKKIARCAAEGIPLIQIGSWQFAEGRKWWRPLQQFVCDL